MKKLLVIISFVCFSFLLFSCKGSANKTSDNSSYCYADTYGYVGGETYHNDYLGMTVDLKGDWFIADYNKIFEQDIETLSQFYDEETAKKKVMSVMEHQVALLQIFNNKKLADADCFFKLLMNSKQSSDLVQDGRQYLQESINKITHPNIRISGEIDTRNIGGKDFGHVRLENNSGDHSKIFQDIYAGKIKDNIILIQLTYQDDAAYSKLEKLISGIKFE